MLRDLRHALRVLRRAPVFATAVIATVALAVGATTAIFGFVDAAMLRPPPFPEPERLMLLYRTVPLPDGHTIRTRWSYPAYAMLRDNVRGFAPVATMTHSTLNLGTPDFPARVEGEMVSATYFAALGVRPLLGRVFAAEEDATPGTHPVIVLGYETWRRGYAADPRVVGSVVRANGVRLTVVGVMPPGFEGLSGRGAYWVPNMMGPVLFYADQLTSDQDFINVVGRLAPGVAPERALAELAALGRRIGHEVLSEPYPMAGERAATALPLDEARADPARRHALLVLLGAVGFVLLIACANLANLFAVRVRARTREIAIRLSLGAERGRIVRQLLAESVLLAAAGGMAGLAVAAGGIRLLGAHAVATAAAPGNDYAQLSDFGAARLDWRVAAFALALATVVGVAFGLVPSLQAARADLSAVIKGAASGFTRAGGGRRRRALTGRGALVAGEVALALVTLLGAALMLESLARLRSVPTGFRPEGVVALWVNMPEARFPQPSAAAVIGRLVERVAALPGVASVTVSRCTPFSSRCARHRVVSDRGPTAAAGGDGLRTGRHYVGPDHFATLGIALRSGRAFTAADRAGSPRVAVVNEAAARALWPGEDPLGKRLWVGTAPRPADSAMTVVGVVADVRYWPAGEPAGPDIYTPYAQFTYPSTYVMVRSAAPPAALTRAALTRAALTRAVREAARAVDPNLAVDDGRPLAAWVEAAAAGTRYDAAVLSALAGAALLLAAVGIYGVMAYSVGRRTRELGIRIALGATPARVLGTVLGEGALLGAAGVAVGLVTSLAVARALRAMLYQVSATDAALYAGGALFVLAVAVGATLIPARRATRVDPMVALRAE